MTNDTGGTGAAAEETPRQNVVPVHRALVSVSDKTGLEDLVRNLARHGIEILSTGGTARSIRDAGLDVQDVSARTRFPEILDGRVKTLHPAVHGGLLAERDNAGHLRSLEAHGISGIDLLVVNLYPFESMVEAGGDFAACIENIDVGGPAMLRAAAKNHRFVCTVSEPGDYGRLIAELDANDGCTTLATRLELAQVAFARTAAYDAAVANWMARFQGTPFPRRSVVSGRFARSLAYGENPHQRAAFYADGSNRPGIASARQLQGKDLSYNNIHDGDAALNLVADLGTGSGHACVIVKHANPCGAACRPSQVAAYEAAFDCDRTSAFGGIVAFDTELTEAAALAVTRTFTEVVVAPSAEAGACAVLAAKGDLRLLVTGSLPDTADGRQLWRQVSGGFLAQDAGPVALAPGDLDIVTGRAPSPEELKDMLFAWTVARHVASNAIVFALDRSTTGIGAGQMSRVDSARLAAWKAEDMARVTGTPFPRPGLTMASDAFLPFADGVETAAGAGVSAIIQPGGSRRDSEVIRAADAAGIAMAFTGVRQFRH